MSTKTLTATDASLLKQLKNSHLDEAQKASLESLIPHMTEQEKDEVLGYINESNVIDAEQQVDYQKQMATLNQTYTQKSQGVVKEVVKQALQGMESIDQNKVGKEVKNLEEEITNMNSNQK